MSVCILSPFSAPCTAAAVASCHLRTWEFENLIVDGDGSMAQRHEFDENVNDAIKLNQ